MIPTLRFHIDEDTLRFIVDFFSFYKKEQEIEVESIKTKNDAMLFEYFELSPIHAIVDYKPKERLGEIIAQFRSGSSLWVIKAIHLQDCQIELREIKLTKVKTLF